MFPATKKKGWPEPPLGIVNVSVLEEVLDGEQQLPAAGLEPRFAGGSCVRIRLGQSATGAGKAQTLVTVAASPNCGSGWFSKLVAEMRN